MLKLPNGGACETFPSLERNGKGRKLYLLSANSYEIRDGVKRNVFFLQRVRMQKLINGSMRNDAPFLKERGNDDNSLSSLAVNP